MNARRAVRWTLQHAMVRAVLRRAARAGDLQAQLILDPATRSDPFPTHDRIRSQGRLVRGKLSYVSASHAACKQVLRSDDFRTGSPATRLPPVVERMAAWSRRPRALGPVEAPSLLAVEPPEHTRYRRLVSTVFTARAVESLRERVQDTAEHLLDGLDHAARAGPVDLVAAYCSQLPLTVIAEILGVPAQDRARVLEFGHGAAPSLDVGLTWWEFRQVDAALHAFDTWLGDHLERLRRNPGSDLLSQLVTVEEEGQRLNEGELRATAGLLLAAGFETTVNLLGSGTELLLRHPALWSNAVEEVLRFESPVQVTARVAQRDTAVLGVPVRAGRMVATMLSGANRDPAVFTDPHRFDVRRANAREHLSFSAGRHFCLGAALARIEGEVGLRSLFERFPDLALAPGAQRRATRVLRGWRQLPVLLGEHEPVG